MEPVTRGSRWASFFRVQSMVADDGRRVLLHGLDRSVIEARAKQGDQYESVRSLRAGRMNDG